MAYPQAQVFEIDGLDDIHGLPVSDWLKARMMGKLAWQDGALPVKMYDDIIKAEVAE